MNHLNRRWQHRREAGQTLVVALIILGLLMILGFVFLAVISRNIQSSARLNERSIANDLAEAGIRYAHAQLLNSELGADWRGRPSTLAGIQGDTTLDPDVLYLRPGSGLPWPGNPQQIDMGGPDGMGPYTRVSYTNGRALIRVRYSPTDANILAGSVSASLRTGAQRDYTTIEAVGREGAVNTQDPTSLARTSPVQYQNFADTAQLEQSLAAMRANDQQMAGSRRLRAFASIGIIETARFITNNDRVTRPAEIGIPSDLGARIGNIAIGLTLPLQIGGTDRFFGVPGQGSIHVNGDLVINGETDVNLNPMLGERISASGTIRAKDDNSRLVVRTSRYNGSTWNVETNTIGGAALDSRNPGFNTFGGALLDGMASTDANGFTRDVGYKTPPSILTKDPDRGELKYRVMSRESGRVVSRVVNGETQVRNTGQFGHGRNVYVDNFSDRQIGFDETARVNTGGDESLVYDWLNPGNTQPRSGWQGSFYIPRAAHVELRYDGFDIVRDARGPDEERYWRNPSGLFPTDGSGATVQTSRIRYRIGTPPGSLTPHIVNTFTQGVNINSAAPNFALGQEFNGVLFFEGNVRVRGVIPTDVQMSIVSMGTIYIEGSITKGVVGNHVTANYPQNFPYPAEQAGNRLRRASRSMLMLAAKDYVAVNTSMFFGPSQATQTDVVSGASNYSAIRVPATADPSQLPTFVTDFALDPNSGASPDLWSPYAAGYGWRDVDTVVPIPTRLVLTHTMSEGPASATFMSLNINSIYTDTPTTTPSAYNFPRTATDWTDSTATEHPPLAIFAENVAANLNLAGDPTHSVLYGLGAEQYQRYANFETVAFPIVNNQPGALTVTATTMQSDVTPGFSDSLFTLFTQGGAQTLNEFQIRPNSTSGFPTNDYLIARAALMPHDIRIEATIFAEEGSFFVIPGPWFNANPNDSREAYDAFREANGGLADDNARRLADLYRLEQFGTTPIAPFYGEPVDVRIRVIGAVSENMPPPMAAQAEWLRKWGWIPKQIGALYHYGRSKPVIIPESHVVGTGFETITDPNNPRSLYVPNLTITYDPALATARVGGFVTTNNPFDPISPAIRWDDFGRSLPPIPRLPVSPTLAYFGEVK